MSRKEGIGRKTAWQAVTLSSSGQWLWFTAQVIGAYKDWVDRRPVMCWARTWGAGAHHLIHGAGGRRWWNHRSTFCPRLSAFVTRFLPFLATIVSLALFYEGRRASFVVRFTHIPIYMAKGHGIIPGGVMSCLFPIVVVVSVTKLTL